MYNQNTSGEAGYTEYCKIPLAKPEVSASHPFKNPDNHEKLLRFLRQRLYAGKVARDQRIPRLVRIDKNVAGWMRLSDADKERDARKDRDGTPIAVQMNLPLSFVHLDDMMTYFAQTFAPNRGMFYHTGAADEVDEGSQIVTLMNNHAIYAGYFREVLLGLFSLLKYNEGGYHVTWSRESGPKIVSEGQEARIEESVQWQGNRLESLDQYNHLYDPMVHPTKLHVEGEFSGIAMLKSYYWLQERASRGIYFNCETALGGQAGVQNCKYYRSPPQEAQFQSNDSSGSGTNWVNILSMTSGYANSVGYEIVETYIRINPTEFGLVPKNEKFRNRYEIWRLSLLNDEWIIGAQYMNNMHNQLPHYLGLLNDDLMSTAQKSVAEILQPLQDFASYLLNLHVAATRSNVWGLTVYDSSVVDLKQIPQGEVNARIPTKPGGQGKDLSKSIWTQNATMDTKQTLGDLEALMGIINQFFPTQSLPSQIASIDRAVTDQVAAVQQGANRRQQKAAKLLDDTLFRNLRFAMYYNIIQYQPDQDEVVDFFTGKSVKIDLAKLRNTNLPFIIGQGLKALDRQAAADALQQVIFALIQAPQAAQEIDLLALIDYWTSMIDIDMDMKQFYRQQVQPGAAPTPESPGAAPTGIQPATNPAAVTSPIYG